MQNGEVKSWQPYGGKICQLISARDKKELKSDDKRAAADIFSAFV